jgi:molybdopterin-containing oxidoreductase family iron-sulfur binding subunit
MVIDVDRCTGCKACVVACRAENNIPVIGEEQSAMGRQMDWINVDRYWEGEYPEVGASFVPLLCQQCGKAPCESVCPVYASQHTSDGLNAQIYNRCIGTRFCANNCPYHVRVFNFYDPYFPAPLEQQLNPDVTVRSSGVMDKCTFCVQRIRFGRRDADQRGAPLQDGELRPACVQACPTSAMVFGKLSDETSAVFKLARSPRAIRMLEETDTQPHVIYLKGQKVEDVL